MQGGARRAGRLPLAKLSFAANELVPPAADARRWPFQDLVVQQVSHAAVELRAISAEEHHVEVVALVPVAFRTELAFHEIEKLRAGQRVRDAHADVVGPGKLQ